MSETGVFQSFNLLHVKGAVNSAFWCFSVLDSSNTSNLFCLWPIMCRGCGLSIKICYIYIILYNTLVTS